MVTAAEISPDGRRLALAIMDGSVLLLAMPERKPVQVMRGHSDSIVDMAFSPDGTLLATAGRDSTGRVWNVETGQERLNLTCESRVRAANFSPDGKLVAFSASKPALWNLASDQRVESPGRLVSASGFLPDGSLVGFTEGSKEVAAWNPASGEYRPLLTDPDGGYELFVSPDGRHIAINQPIAQVDGQAVRVCRLALWDLKNQTKVGNLEGHTAHIYSAAFSPDGKTLASSSTDGTVRLWNMPPNGSAPGLSSKRQPARTLER